MPPESTSPEPTINIRIEADESSIANSQLLQDLRKELERETEIPCNVESVPAPEGTQGLEITTAVKIVTASVSVATLIFNIIKFYLENKKTNSAEATLEEAKARLQNEVNANNTVNISATFVINAEKVTIINNNISQE